MFACFLFSYKSTLQVLPIEPIKTVTKEVRKAVIEMRNSNPSITIEEIQTHLEELGLCVPGKNMPTSSIIKK